MKKALVILMMLLSLVISGCKYLPPAQPAEPQPQKPVEEPQPQLETEDSLPEKEATEQGISNDGMLHFPEGSITILAYEEEMDLTEILGKPLEEEINVLENADTFTGSYKKTLTFEDTRLVLFSPPQDGQRFYLINIETESKNVTSDRGITIGDTLEDLQQAYPEVTRSLDGTTGTDGCYEMMFQDNPYTYLFFYVKEGKVMKLQVLHEFA